MITLSMINNKGGVGKTTSTACLGELLAFLGKKVLLVDMDPQGNLSMLYGVYYDDREEDSTTPKYPNIADLFSHRFREKEQVESVVYKTDKDNLSIIPATHRHNNTISIVSQKTSGNNAVILKRALDTIKAQYDYILIDNAPADNLMTVNSMMVSNYVYIPAETDAYSYKGVQQTIQTILEIKEDHYIDSLQLGGVFLTKAEIATNNFKKWQEIYQQEIGDLFLKTPIRKDVKIKEKISELAPMLQGNAGSNAISDYAALLIEMHILDAETEQILRLGFAED